MYSMLYTSQALQVSEGQIRMLGVGGHVHLTGGSSRLHCMKVLALVEKILKGKGHAVNFRRELLYRDTPLQSPPHQTRR